VFESMARQLIMDPMQRKPQQQTLSLRIPAELRNYLERAREVFASHKHEFLSTSDVGKLLLESAIDDRLDDRMEVADLRIRTAEALWAIRCKWEQHHDLSRAEWIFLAQHVQAGCEGLADDPGLPQPESFAQVLEAFMAVRTLRRERGVELDRYYLENLGLAGGAALRQRQLDSDLVPRIVTALIRQLRESTPQPKSVFVGRILYVALREESLEGIASVNESLCPYLPVLYRLAARGHWLRERRPVRPDGGGNHFVSRAFPPMLCGEYRLSICVTNAGEAEMVIEMDSKGISYTLGTYPRIREFATLLARLKAGDDWTGREFRGYTNAVAGEPATRFCFLHRNEGFAISFTRDDWESLQDLLGRALALPELQPVLGELALVYGEI
jgi:hypothetical protein